MDLPSCMCRWWPVCYESDEPVLWPDARSHWLRPTRPASYWAENTQTNWIRLVFPEVCSIRKTKCFKNAYRPILRNVSWHHVTPFKVYQGSLCLTLDFSVLGYLKHPYKMKDLPCIKRGDSLSYHILSHLPTYVMTYGLQGKTTEGR